MRYGGWVIMPILVALSNQELQAQSAPSPEPSQSNSASVNKSQTSPEPENTADEGNAKMKPSRVSGEDRTETSSEGCLVSETALLDLKSARAQLAAEKSRLKARAAELDAQQDAIDQEMKKLLELRDSLKKETGAQTQAQADRVTKLVETLLTMSPKAAAKVVANLDDQLAVQTMRQMDTLKLAKILNLVEPERSAELSELLAGAHPASSPSTQLPSTSRKKGARSQPAKKSREADAN